MILPLKMTILPLKMTILPLKMMILPLKNDDLVGVATSVADLRIALVRLLYAYDAFYGSNLSRLRWV